MSEPIVSERTPASSPLQERIDAACRTWESLYAGQWPTGAHMAEAQRAVSSEVGVPVIVSFDGRSHIMGYPMPMPSIDAETREVVGDLFEARGYAEMAGWVRWAGE